MKQLQQSHIGLLRLKFKMIKVCYYLVGCHFHAGNVKSSFDILPYHIGKLCMIFFCPVLLPQLLLFYTVQF